MIESYYKIIEDWILSLIKNKPDEKLLSLDFTIEDGLNKLSYIQSELEAYQTLSSIYNLNHNFIINIIYEQKLKDKTKKIIYFLIKNNLNKIVCRTNVTIDQNNKITGNNYNTHISPKHIINNEKTINIGFALKSKNKIISIISPNLEINYFSKGSNFQTDSFYIVSLSGEIIEKSDFYFKFEKTIEKREVFFGLPDLSCKPYDIHNNKVTLKDNYPLNISYKKEDLIINQENPRKLCLPFGEMTITDCLDNDWILN